MDPTACLAEIRKLLEDNELFVMDDNEAHRLIELMESLDNWMTGGGFLPEQWKVLRK